MKIKFKNKFLKMPRREFEAKRAMGQIPPADIKKWYKANGREDLQIKSESNHKGNKTMKIKLKSKKQSLLERKIYRALMEEIGSEDSSGKKIYVLVGPPSVGKSTWVKNNAPDSYVINRDDIVEKVAKEYNWTYDDMFFSPSPEEKIGDENEKYGKVVESPSYMTWQPLSYDKVLKANGKVFNLFKERVSGASPSGKDIVVDMTNMNSGARANALKAIEGSEDQYEKVAVIFPFEGAEDIIKTMAAKRAAQAKKEGRSKTIPEAAFDRMFKSFQDVSKEEGFDKIITHDTREALKQSIDEE